MRIQVCSVNRGVVAGRLLVAILLCTSGGLFAGTLPPAYAQSAPQNSPSSASLQSLVDQTAAQLRLSYRNNRAEHLRRYNQLSAAIARWRASARSEEDNRRLAAWLRRAMRDSMPGSQRALAALPEFVDPRRAIAVQPAAATTVRQKPVATNARPEADFWSDHPASRALPAEFWGNGNPFYDDPVTSFE